MRQTHNTQADIDHLISALSASAVLQEKVRINLYLPKAVVRLIDALAPEKSRGELVTKLVIEKAKKSASPLYGLFSPLEISDKELDTITHSWENTLHDGNT